MEFGPGEGIRQPSHEPRPGLGDQSYMQKDIIIDILLYKEERKTQKNIHYTCESEFSREQSEKVIIESLVRLLEITEVVTN